MPKSALWLLHSKFPNMMLNIKPVSHMSCNGIKSWICIIYVKCYFLILLTFKQKDLFSDATTWKTIQIFCKSDLSLFLKNWANIKMSFTIQSISGCSSHWAHEEPMGNKLVAQYLRVLFVHLILFIHNWIGRPCFWVFFQFCDVAKVTIVHKMS